MPELVRLIDSASPDFRNCPGVPDTDNVTHFINPLAVVAVMDDRVTPELGPEIRRVRILLYNNPTAIVIYNLTPEQVADALRPREDGAGK